MNLTKIRWCIFVSLWLASWPLYTAAQQPTWEKQMIAGGTAKEKGNLPEAEKQLRAALETAKKFQTPDQRTATNLNNLGEVLHLLGRYSEAEQHFGHALGIMEKTHGPNHSGIAMILNNIAGLKSSQGQYAEAEPIYKRAMGISQKAFGPDHLRVALGLNNLSHLYRKLGRYAEVEPLMKRSLKILEKAVGPNHPHVATVLGTLADTDM